jgi:hypothetical protein
MSFVIGLYGPSGVAGAQSPQPLVGGESIASRRATEAVVTQESKAMRDGPTAHPGRSSSSRKLPPRVFSSKQTEPRRLDAGGGEGGSRGGQRGSDGLLEATGFINTIRACADIIRAIRRFFFGRVVSLARAVSFPPWAWLRGGAGERTR